MTGRYYPPTLKGFEKLRRQSEAKYTPLVQGLASGHELMGLVDAVYKELRRENERLKGEQFERALAMLGRVP